ncbi:STAS domain-containing protein [Sorangium sp. So ce1078]|uniref:STAS domain-containing protein n=1 Tax=Sorangium sp. So ce1078 TaxID=3133329 RepID=UPI003F5DCDA0
MTGAGKPFMGAESQKEPEAELGEAELLLRTMLDTLPVAVCRYDREGIFRFHDGKGLEVSGVRPGEHLGKSIDELYAGAPEVVESIRQAIEGKGSHTIAEAHGFTWETWVVPVRHGGEPGAVSITMDATQAKQREQDLRNKLALIEKQQKVIRDLSTPIIEVWDNVLTLPMVGVVDSLRISEVMDNLLTAIVNKDARFAILDLTGVDAVDTRTAGYIIEMIKAIGLLGAEGIVTGIRSNVAQTMIALGLDMSGVTTVGNLRAGLKLCMRRMAATGEAGEAGRVPGK